MKRQKKTSRTILNSKIDPNFEAPGGWEFCLGFFIIPDALRRPPPTPQDFGCVSFLGGDPGKFVRR